MKKEWTEREKVLAVLIGGIFVLGAVFGFLRVGIGWGDTDRIEKQLRKVNLYEITGFEKTARGIDGMAEERIFDQYLREFQKEAAALAQYNGKLKILAENGADGEEISELERANESAYKKLCEMVEKEKMYIQTYIRENGRKYIEYDNEEFISGWAEELQAAGCQEALEGKIGEMYEENCRYLKEIKERKEAGES